MPRVSRKEADRHRADVIRAAARLIPEHGIDGVSVPALMAQAGLTPGDIDPHTGRKVRLHIGHIVDKSLGGKDELSNLRTLCSTCNQGAKNITPEKPSLVWLLSQVRRATESDQKAVRDWLDPRSRRTE